MKRIIIGLVALLSITSVRVFAQNAPIAFTLEDVEVDNFSVNETICMNMTVTGFTDVLGYQFVVSYDPNKLTFNICDSFLPSENNTTWNHIPSTSTIRFTWIPLMTLPYSAADGTVAHELCFDVTSDLATSNNACTGVQFNPSEQYSPVEIIALNSTGISVYSENEADLGAGSICMAGSSIGIVEEITNVCLMDNTMGSCVLEPNFGVAPYFVTFSNCDDGMIISSMTIDEQAVTLSDLEVGNYCLEITDSAAPAASVSEQFEITSGVSWNTELVISDVNCSNSLDGSACALVTSADLADPTNAFNYTWSNGGESNCIQNVAAGHYQLIISEKSTGCTFEQIVSITEAEDPPINVDLGEDILVTPGDKVELSPAVNLLGTAITYNWSPANILSCTDCPNPSLVGLIDANNIVNLTVSDELGCVANDQLHIHYDKTSGGGNTPTNDTPTGEISDNSFHNIWNNTFFTHDATYQIVLTDVAGRILFQQSRWTSVEALQEAVRTLNIASNQLYIGAFWRLDVETGVSKKQFYLFQE